MTLGDLLKRAKPEDLDKVIVYSDGIGWTNIDFLEKTDSTITIGASSNAIFSDDK